jgi:hypothetical protein
MWYSTSRTATARRLASQLVLPLAAAAASTTTAVFLLQQQQQQSKTKVKTDDGKHATPSSFASFFQTLTTNSRTMNIAFCDEARTTPSTATITTSTTPISSSSVLLRKRHTLQQATVIEEPTPPPLTRSATKTLLNQVRKQQTKLLRQWQLDEEGWTKLPARAWPAFQPDPEQLQDIQDQLHVQKCREFTRLKEEEEEDANDNATSCQELYFQVATALVFYNLDPIQGLEMFQQLADNNNTVKNNEQPQQRQQPQHHNVDVDVDVDSMVACGIILIEGMGVVPQEHLGVQYLQRAVQRGSIQGMYELAAVLYTGLDDHEGSVVLEENPSAAFAMFQQAAHANHTAALYMAADCLVEGEGTERSVSQAIPLFLQAAEQGHRYSRQRIRELLATTAGETEDE